MSDLFIDPTAIGSLALLVETVTAPMLMAHSAPVCLEVDVDPDVSVPADVSWTVDLIQSLTRQILAELPDGGDLMITACETANTIELEMADSGGDIADRPTSLPIAAAKVGATVRWQNCPQGGAAVTIVFPRRFQAQSKAA